MYLTEIALAVIKTMWKKSRVSNLKRNGVGMHRNIACFGERRKLCNFLQMRLQRIEYSLKTIKLNRQYSVQAKV